MKTFIEGCRMLGLDLTPQQVAAFETYRALLIEWNEKINLTAITDPEEILTKHFLDSLTPLTLDIFPPGASVIDVGTGAGFPGLPLRLVREDLSLTLLDSLAKRLKVLEEICSATPTQGVRFVHSRAEDGGRSVSLRESFDVAVSRAVANLSVLCEYCLPFVKVGGYFAALKGPGAQGEIEEGKKAITQLGGTLENVASVSIPFTDLNHTIVVIRKTAHCPEKYPRKAGKPSKSPIK